MSPQMTSSCDINIINIIIIVMIVQFLLYERYLIQFSIRRNKAFLLSHSHARRKKKDKCHCENSPWRVLPA